MPIDSEMASRRDSWPPTQVRLTTHLSDKDEPRPLLEIDDDPLTYFLTPAPALEDDDFGGELDFDAGIETPGQLKDIVRSVSPSTLDGLSKHKNRPASPDYDSDALTTDDDDEDEDYIRFNPNSCRLLTLSDFAIDSLRKRSRTPPIHQRTASFPPAQARGRSNSRGRPCVLRSLSARARPNHLWRQPSPDVWSIEEETEEELLSIMVSSAAAKNQKADKVKGNKTVDQKTAKSFKKVRFLLPPLE